MSPRILVVDNYDSFVFNLVQYLVPARRRVRGAAATTRYRRPHAQDGFDGVLLSPGPGTPEQAGGVHRHGARTARRPQVPIFGVCLGMQSMQCGVRRLWWTGAPELLHGKTSPGGHTTAPAVFAGLPRPFTATPRYHSLAAEPATVPAELEVTARTPDGDRDGHCATGIAAASRASSSTPESVLTEHGHRMLANWLMECGDRDAVARSAGLAPVVGRATA